ncbi:unnamed protein product [Heligmosomoides polygyrus]|uniref:Uncharacterized protein n=1 Tax=Heligmosomoides polygyrus TaxID=6339 RepID=A0A183F289_HELPZ|nr:unnamed protein product [Heligmosomoides polygyrus]
MMNTSSEPAARSWAGGEESVRLRSSVEVEERSQMEVASVLVEHVAVQELTGEAGKMERCRWWVCQPEGTMGSAALSVTMARILVVADAADPALLVVARIRTVVRRKLVTTRLRVESRRREESSILIENDGLEASVPEAVTELSLKAPNGFFVLI